MCMPEAIPSPTPGLPSGAVQSWLNDRHRGISSANLIRCRPQFGSWIVLQCTNKSQALTACEQSVCQLHGCGRRLPSVLACRGAVSYFFDELRLLVNTYLPRLTPSDFAQATAGSNVPSERPQWVQSKESQLQTDPYGFVRQQLAQQQQQQQQQQPQLQLEVSAEGGPPRERSPPIPVPLVKKKRT